MKHLRLLEEAGLVVSRRSGRKRLHFLNPVPIRLIHDRWIDKYTEAFAMALSDLKYELEHQMEKIYEIYIRTTPERLWEAIYETRDPCQVHLRHPGGLGLDGRVPPGTERPEIRPDHRRG